MIESELMFLKHDIAIKSDTKLFYVKPNKTITMSDWSDKISPERNYSIVDCLRSFRETVNRPLFVYKWNGL